MEVRLAEALSLRADLYKRIQQVHARVVENARVQEGDPPGEDPAALILNHHEMVGQFEKLVAQINRTNLTIQVGDLTMTEALSRRDALKMLAAMHRAAADATAGKQARLTRTEVKYVPTLNVSEQRRESDHYARLLRELDVKIQEANWSNDLVE